MENRLIQIINLSKTYSDKFGYNILLFENLSFDLVENKLTSIVAPRGAGKSTLLKMIAGLESGFEGEIKINTNDKIISIPSEPSSFPWLSVKENLLFAKPDAGENELKRTIKIIGLEGYEDHKPDNRSAGFRFRISLGRALILEPAAVLLDDPFEKLSPSAKVDIYSLIRRVNSEFSTLLLATTNISESILLSDEIHLMTRNPGAIIASFNIDLPEERSPELMDDKKFIEFRTKIEETAKKISSQKLFNFSI